MLHAIHSANPRNTWIVQAVFRNRGSSPRWFWMMLGPMPTSENIWRPESTTCTRAISPNASGNNSRVRIRLLPSRSTWLAP